MKKVVKIIALVAVAAAVVCLVVINIVGSSTPETDEVWDEHTIIGKTDAAHHYVLYTDLSCGYCYRLSNILVENSNELEKILSEKDIKLEFRIIPYLSSDISLWGAEAMACAADEERFFEYFSLVIPTLGVDYFEGDGSVKIDADYFADLGARMGMSDKFVSCVKNHEKSSAVAEMEKKAGRRIASSSGVPYLKFGKYASGGFDSSWGWAKVQQMLEAGL